MDGDGDGDEIGNWIGTLGVWDTQYSMYNYTMHGGIEIGLRACGNVSPLNNNIVLGSMTLPAMNNREEQSHLGRRVIK